MVVLIDADVIFDYVASWEPYYHDANNGIGLCCSGKVKGYRGLGSLGDRRKSGTVLKAVDMKNFKDFEDCLQDRCAEKVNAGDIVIRNVKDFKKL